MVLITKDSQDNFLKCRQLCICVNKDADQFHDNREADQCLCFHYMDSIIPLLPKPLPIFCDCIARFMSDLVGNPEDRFSRYEAPIMVYREAHQIVSHLKFH